MAPPYPPTPPAAPALAYRHSLSDFPSSLAPQGTNPQLQRAGTLGHQPYAQPPSPAPPFQHHNSDGTHPYRASTSYGGAQRDGLIPMQESIRLHRERTLRQADEDARASAGAGQQGDRGFGGAGADGGRWGYRKLTKSRPTPQTHHTSVPTTAAPGGSSYPPLPPLGAAPAVQPAYPAAQPPTSFKTSTDRALPGAPVILAPIPYGGYAPAPPPGATHAVSPSVLPSSAAPIAGPSRPHNDPELVAVQRASREALAAEQARLASLREQEQRLVRLTLEQSTASAALEQLRATALARERAAAEERALREAVLSSQSDEARKRREEVRRRIAEEEQVQKALRENERANEAAARGKGKGKAVLRAPPAREEEEDEVDWREREALELAMQLSLQDEEKRRWYGDVHHAGPAASSSQAVESERAGPAAATDLPAEPSEVAALFPSSASDDLAYLDDAPPPAYEYPAHARECDEPGDVIFGPSHPLPDIAAAAPSIAAPAPPTGAAPPRPPRPASYAYPQASYPSFAPYGADESNGAASSSTSLSDAPSVSRSSSGYPSIVASAGSFEDAPPPLQTLQLPESALTLDEQELTPTVEDPFADSHAIATEAGSFVSSARSSSPSSYVPEPSRSEQHDLFAAVLARRAAQRLEEMGVSTPAAVASVEEAAPVAPEQEVTTVEPRGLSRPSPPPRTTSAPPTSAAPPSLLLPPAPAAPTASASAPSTPAVPSPSSFRNDPSHGGLVEDLFSNPAFADEAVLRDVRWGFDESAQGRRFPLAHEGDFPRGAQLSAIEVEGGARPFRAFAVEARTWKGLLVYLMWHGNSRFEAAPHDLQSDKSGRGLQVEIRLDFHRAGAASSSSGVSIRPPRVRVSLTLLSPDPNAPARLDPSFTLATTPSLEPVNPSVQLVLSARPFLPIPLSALAQLLSLAHTASRQQRRLSRQTAVGTSQVLVSPLDPRLVLARAVDLFRRLNGEEVRREDEEDEEADQGDEVGLIDRMKGRLRFGRRKPRLIVGGTGEVQGGDLPEGAMLITPFSIDDPHSD
ncbi:hypothetical protein Rhopal_000996-T1 [Rhodotorula paludigena]|uniref:Proteophosphoglycan ppg4 n=1 Tax=Rhodotorula paludigena TaxID=86838 RepID=A0AAV5G6H4_9BASI|nr:hypothetical protein Rhopal_000996-T1 [Rhodotorula paludigena]